VLYYPIIRDKRMASHYHGYFIMILRIQSLLSLANEPVGKGHFSKTCFFYRIKNRKLFSVIEDFCVWQWGLVTAFQKKLC
jgi:hypothetical protein